MRISNGIRCVENGVLRASRAVSREITVRTVIAAEEARRRKQVRKDLRAVLRAMDKELRS